MLTLIALSTGSLLANVYPTNIKINGGITNVSVSSGSSVKISYILNEPASAGVLVKVLAGSNTVRTISIAGGAAGALRGTNSVVWDGNDNNSSPVAAGTYSVAITAGSHGYSGWTQTSDDNADGNNVWQGRGIAADQNTNSPYYGRVVVANAGAKDPGANNWLGYQVGILKCNADGSYADEGGLSTGDYPWVGDGYSPWHLAVSHDDSVYIDDFALSTNGVVIRWDALISTNSKLLVLGPTNWADLNAGLSGPALAGAGTNMTLWMADTTFTGAQTGRGILRYSLLPNGTCATNDTGTTAVAVGGSLGTNPVAVALDAKANIYTIQSLTEPGDPHKRVFRFPPFNPLTNSAAPLTNADWAVGANDDTMAGANGIAVDPTGRFVAVSFTGLSTGSNGCTQIFYATNGALVTNLDLGVSISGFSDHVDVDCAWDAVGNVYYIDDFFAVWRAVSPPGTNQATTVALATIQVVGSGPAIPPQIIEISFAAGMVTIDFSAGTNDTASAFKIVGAASVTGPYSTVSGVTITRTAPGRFQATFPASGTDQYFRISRQGGTPPPSQPSFTGISVSGQNVVLKFDGSTTDLASSFTLLAAPTINGSYSTANANITQLSPGVFQATVSASGPAQFYKIRK